MASAVVDDHLLRDILTGTRHPTLGGLAQEGIATTGLWLFRLCSSFADPTVSGRLSAPVSGLPEPLQARFRALLIALPPEINVLGLREMAWPMAELQQRHRSAGRHLSAAMAEALATAHALGAAIVVSRADVGPQLKAASDADGIPFHIV